MENGISLSDNYNFTMGSQYADKKLALYKTDALTLGGFHCSIQQTIY